MNQEPIFRKEFREEPNEKFIRWRMSDELDACTVFKAKNRKYLVVRVSGCSCWPSKGTTTQIICNNKQEVDRELISCGYSELIDKLQLCEWKITKKI